MRDYEGVPFHCLLSLACLHRILRILIVHVEKTSKIDRSLWNLFLGASVRLETANERFCLLRPVNRSFLVVCVGWQVRALRVLHSPSPLLYVYSFDEVQHQVNGFNGWSKVSSSYSLEI